MEATVTGHSDLDRFLISRERSQVTRGRLPLVFLH